MPSDSVVQLPPDSTGQKIAVRKVTSPSPVDASGNAQDDVEANQQVISLADRRGDYRLEESMPKILAELVAIRDVLEVISLKLE